MGGLRRKPIALCTRDENDDIADDLQDGAVTIRHPELMKQLGRKR
jgi:hypothetical protein